MRTRPGSPVYARLDRVAAGPGGRFMDAIAKRTLVLISAVLVAGGTHAASASVTPNPSATVRRHGGPEAARTARLPFWFEANRGQTAPEVAYLARCRGYTAFLGDRGSITLRTRHAALRMSFDGAPPTARWTAE